MTKFQTQEKAFKGLQKLFKQQMKEAKSTLAKNDAMVKLMLCDTMSDLCKLMGKEEYLVKKLSIKKKRKKKA